MKSSIYISAEKIEVVGYAGRSVKRYVTYPLPEGTMINGMITEASFLTECLAAMRTENPDLFKSPSLIVDGSAILSRRLVTPKLNHKRYLQLVRDDFADATTDSGQLVCGYYKLKSQAEDAILACAVDKGLADAYIYAFRAAGIKLTSIRVGAEALVNLIDSSPALSKGSFVLTLLDGFTAVSMIFENGSNVFMSRARLYGETKEQIFQNILDNLNGLVNFNRSQKFSEITQCYYLGVNETDVSLIQALNPYAGIQMSLLNLFGEGTGALPPESHFAYLNALMPAGCIDLIAGRKQLDKHVKSKKTRNKALPLLLLYLLILALPIGYMWWQVYNLDEEIRAVSHQLNSAGNEVLQAELESLETETGVYNGINSQYRELESWDASLTRVSSDMLDLFIVGHRRLAEITQFDYDERSNSVRISARSPDSDSMLLYINNLSGSDMVASIGYQGFDTNSEGETVFNIEVTLAVRAATGEEAE
ncbi:MAG: hypothetical protein FWG72_02370 [Oscillospiraceae bacterium]|nr:hypothetical protein [Oscillospiraceae bacterium]